jgi:hypothetical protein
VYKELLVVITKDDDSWSHVNRWVYTVSSNYYFLFQKFHPLSFGIVSTPCYCSSLEVLGTVECYGFLMAETTRMTLGLASTEGSIRFN